MRPTRSRCASAVAPPAWALPAFLLVLLLPAGLSGQEPQAADSPEAEASIPAQQAVQDEAIRERLQTLFDEIGSIRDVTVEVRAGVVRLDGRALSLEAREQAVDLARRTEGVAFVEDRIRVVADLGQRLEPALNRIRNYAVETVAFLPLLAAAILVAVAFGLLGGWVASLDGPHLRFARTSFHRTLARQVIRVVFGLIGVLVALEMLGATALVGAVLGTAGILGLAVGFAFKDIVENHLAGVMLSLRQPFAPNDYIAVGGHEGKVVRLTARETILMSPAGNHVRIPNGEIYRTVTTNFTRNHLRRFEIPVSVSTDEDLAEAGRIGRTALEEMPGVIDDPGPGVLVRELGESWVTLDFNGWVDQQEVDFLRVRSEAVRAVKAALDRAGVSMPPPEYEVRLREGDEEPPSAAEAPAAPDEGPPTTPLDVSVDRSLDHQIEEDRRRSGERDLLEDGGD